jgi:hypothetical protein
MTDIKEFGIKRDNEERRDGGCAVVFDPASQKYAVYRNLKDDLLGLYGGGFNDENESEQDGMLRELIEESGLYDFLHIEKIEKVLTHYYNSNKEINRVALATCFLVILKSTNLQPTKLEAHENFELKWVAPEEMLSNWKLRNNDKSYDHWFYFLEKSVNRAIKLGHDKTNKKM